MNKADAETSAENADAICLEKSSRQMQTGARRLLGNPPASILQKIVNATASTITHELVTSSGRMKIETLAVHAGQRIDPATGAVSPPIHLSTTFERDLEGTYSRGFMYTRSNNTNWQALEEGVSMLEGGVAAAAFGSGMGATGAIFQALAPGDHILAHVDAYYGTSRLLREIFLRWGLHAD